MREPKKNLGAIKGSAIRLDSPRDNFLSVAEGLETALAVRQATGFPMWATGSTAGLKEVRIPGDVKTVLIWADKDNNTAGLNAAEALAQTLYKEDRNIYVLLPTGEIPEGAKSLDWLDVLNSEGEEAFLQTLENTDHYTPLSSVRAADHPDSPLSH